MSSALRSRLTLLRRENAALSRAVRVLHEVASLSHRSLELEPALYAVLTGVTAGVGLGLNRAMLFLVEGSPEALAGWAAVGPEDPAEADRVWKSIEAQRPDLETLYEAGLRQRDLPGPLDLRVRSLRVPTSGDSPLALALRAGSVVRGAADTLDGLLDPETALTAPLRTQHGVRGVLYADNRFTKRRLDATSELVFSLIAQHAGLAVEAAMAFERVARQALTDPLTGLGHRGALEAAVAAAVVRGRRARGPVGLAMVDLDDFKRVNDTWGHPAGDALLRQVADRLRGAVRAGETPFRYGGEEFTVVLPGVTAESLVAVGERLRGTVAGQPFALPGGRSLRVTCSLGLAVLDGETLEASRLIALADDALLRAKALGKNRVELG